MRVVIASDHAGFEMKSTLLSFVKELGLDIEDLGPAAYDETDDYPDHVSKAARAVSQDPEHVRGIVLGGSGQGEAVVANRFPHVRAAVYYGGAPKIVSLSREHNNANILSLGARFMNEDEAKEAVKLWLETQFSGDERHVRRIKKIDNYPA